MWEDADGAEGPLVFLPTGRGAKPEKEQKNRDTKGHQDWRADQARVVAGSLSAVPQEGVLGQPPPCQRHRKEVQSPVQGRIPAQGLRWESRCPG